MAEHVYTVQVTWDEESRTYYVAETDIPGLHSEADTFEALIERVTAVAPELLALNSDIHITKPFPLNFVASRQVSAA